MASNDTTTDHLEGVRIMGARDGRYGLTPASDKGRGILNSREAQAVYDEAYSAAEQVAWGRAETDPCERGTPGCSVLHTRDSECETW